MHRYWFKQKHYGFGAYPASWQGWVLTGVYLLVIGALTAWLVEGAAAAAPRFVTFFTLAGVLTLIFVFICWRTTEGGWRWRWGKDQ